MALSGFFSSFTNFYVCFNFLPVFHCVSFFTTAPSHSTFDRHQLYSSQPETVYNTQQIDIGSSVLRKGYLSTINGSEVQSSIAEIDKKLQHVMNKGFIVDNNSQYYQIRSTHNNSQTSQNTQIPQNNQISQDSYNTQLNNSIQHQHNQIQAQHQIPKISIINPSSIPRESDTSLVDSESIIAVSKPFRRQKVRYRPRPVPTTQIATPQIQLSLANHSESSFVQGDFRRSCQLKC